MGQPEKGFYRPEERQASRRTWPGIIRNRHFWAVTAIFAAAIVLQYPQQLHLTSAPSLFSFIGLSRHAFERILLFIPIGYTIAVFGVSAGFISIVIAAAIMLPRVFLLSQYPADALVETLGVLVVGSVVNLWFHDYKLEKEGWHRTASNLETAYQQLENRALTIEEHEKRLAVLNNITATISQSLELSQILDRAVDGVSDLMKADGAWIYLMNPDEPVLTLSAHRGISEGLPSIRSGYGLSGRVAETGKAEVIDIPEKDATAKSPVKEMQSALIVPIRSKGELCGTLGISSRLHHPYQQSEIDLLSAIGDEIGVAIENARLYRNQQEVAWELRKSEHRYRELFENAHDAIFVHDLNGDMVAANLATSSLIGYPAAELLAMNVQAFLDAESLAAAAQMRNKLLVGEKIDQPYEQRLIRRDGTRAFLKSTTTLLTLDGKPSGFLHIARDVTMEKQMQDQLALAYRHLSESHERLKESQEQLIQAEKLTSLGQLAASIAHEVNNPLSGVLTYNQLLIRKTKDGSLGKDTSLDYLSKMEKELIRSTKLVRNLLDFARQSPPAFRPVNLNEVMSRAYELASHAAKLQRIQVITELDPTMPAVTADFDQLQQVCTNLILNAIQAMTEKGTLTLRTSATPGEVTMEVGDTGCGISPENMNKLFTPFFTTKREVKGVGLGLAVSYGIVQRHRGRIDVRSKLGEGTTMSVHLPLNTSNDPFSILPDAAAEDLGASAANGSLKS